MKIFNINDSGSTLVEVLVAIALAGILLPALATALISANASRPTITQQLQATTLLHQLAEATRTVRDNGWNNFDVNGTYHPTISGSTWTLVSGPETNGNFTDKVVISDVNRDTSGNIVTTGGMPDPSTKLAVATVSWTSPTNSSISTDIYLTRWQNETSWTQTSVSDFSGDTLSNLSVTNVSGGEVQLTTGQTSGTITSSTFDATASVGFNYFNFNGTTPSGTTLKFQIASNNDNSTWNYVGPDGTSSTYYTTGSAVPLSATSGRYFRYQATLSTTSANTPVINDVTLTYSP